jgi:hypothetical protein
VAGIKSNKRKSTIKQYGGGALGVGLGAIGGGVVGAAGSLGALLGGAGTPKKGYSGGGNFGYSKTAPKGSIKKSDPSALGKLWDSSARMRQQQAQLRAQADQKPVEEDTSTPFDNLWSLLQQGGGSFDPNNVQVDTSAYDSQEKTARQNGADADAKLNAMYRQLAQSYLDDNADTKAAYAQTRASVGQAADQATNDIKSSYTSSTNDLNSMLSKLGIQDTAKVIGNKGTSLQGDQAATLSGSCSEQGREPCCDRCELCCCSGVQPQHLQCCQVGGRNAAGRKPAEPVEGAGKHCGCSNQCSELGSTVCGSGCCILAG